MRRFARWFLTMLMLTGLSALAACNTLSGFGRDVEAAGAAIYHSFDHHDH